MVQGFSGSRSGPIERRPVAPCRSLVAAIAERSLERVVHHELDPRRGGDETLGGDLRAPRPLPGAAQLAAEGDLGGAALREAHPRDLEAIADLGLARDDVGHLDELGDDVVLAAERADDEAEEQGQAEGEAEGGGEAEVRGHGWGFLLV